MVLYTDQDQYYSDYIYDISENGIFINTSAPIPVGSMISMSFLSFHNKGPIKIAGNVIRSLPRGIGVKFKVSEKPQKNALNAFIEGFLT